MKRRRAGGDFPKSPLFFPVNRPLLAEPSAKICVSDTNRQIMQLQIDNLSKRYPNGTQALQDVSLTIPQGMFGLLGPNGAGKSTLMRTLATLQEADSGRARLTTS